MSSSTSLHFLKFMITRSLLNKIKPFIYTQWSKVGNQKGDRSILEGVTISTQKFDLPMSSVLELQARPLPLFSPKNSCNIQGELESSMSHPYKKETYYKEISMYISS